MVFATRTKPMWIVEVMRVQNVKTIASVRLAQIVSMECVHPIFVRVRM